MGRYANWNWSSAHCRGGEKPPNHFYDALFGGNAMIGFMLWQPTNRTVRLDISRADVYDDRTPQSTPGACSYYVVGGTHGTALALQQPVAADRRPLALSLDGQPAPVTPGQHRERLLATAARRISISGLSSACE